MELRHLRYFAAIAEESSFSRAAERLRVSQPALSRQIRDLEEEIGRDLFERLNHGSRLTDVGVRFLRSAKKLLATSEAMLAEARGERRSDCPPLSISHFGPLSAQHLSPHLRKLVRRFPRVRLHLEEELPGLALRRVRAGTLDAALSGLPEEVSMRGLTSREVWVVPQEILVASNHRLAKRRRLKLEDLRDEPWGIWDEKVCPGFGRRVIQACRRAGFRARVATNPDSLASIFVHVAENSYVSYAPHFARQLAHPGVVFIPTDPERALDLSVSLVWRSGSPHHDALQWLAESMLPTPKGQS